MRFPDCAVRRHHENKGHGEQIAANPAIIPKSATRSSGTKHTKAPLTGKRVTTQPIGKLVTTQPSTAGD